MIITTLDESKTNKRFSKKLKLYLDKDRFKAACVHGEDCIPTKADAKCIQGDVTHIFNNEAMLAISHAIEDLASETREGELISTFQKFDNFLHQKNRYVSLSKDLDAVRVWGTGKVPSGCNKIDFVPITHRELYKYWVVLFVSPQTHALLVCKQINRSETFSHKIFMGFYTFNPFVVESFRRKLNLMSCGLDKIVKGFNSVIRKPAFSLKELDAFFQPEP